MPPLLCTASVTWRQPSTCAGSKMPVGGRQEGGRGRAPIQCPLSCAQPQNQAAGRTRKARRFRDAEQAFVQGCAGAQRRLLTGGVGVPESSGRHNGGLRDDQAAGCSALGIVLAHHRSGHGPGGTAAGQRRHHRPVLQLQAPRQLERLKQRGCRLGRLLRWCGGTAGAGEGQRRVLLSRCFKRVPMPQRRRRRADDAMLALRPPAQQMSATLRDAEISGVSCRNGAGKQVVAARRTCRTPSWLLGTPAVGDQVDRVKMTAPRGQVRVVWHPACSSVLRCASSCWSSLLAPPDAWKAQPRERLALHEHSR